MKPNVAAAQRSLEELRSHAVHEAGHAVLGILAGQPITRVTVKEGMSVNVPGARTGGSVDVVDGWTPNQDPDRFHLHAVSMLAGPFAEHAHTDRVNVHGWRGDMEWIGAYVEAYRAQTGIDIEGPLHRVALTLVKAWQPAITGVSEELLERETLSGDEVRKIVATFGPVDADSDPAVAAHEAAHTVAAYVLGVPIVAVSIVGRPQDEYGMAASGMVMADDPETFNDADVVVALAGAAWDLLSGRPDWSTQALGDTAYVDRKLGADAYAATLRLMPVATKLVQEHADMILILADALRVRRILLAPEIGALLAGIVLTPEMAQAFHPEVLLDTPAAYWRLNDPGTADSAGNIAALDFSGNARGGAYTATGVTYRQPNAITDDEDGAVTLDGSTGWVGVTPVPFNADVMAVEAWFKADSAFGGWIVTQGVSETLLDFSLFYIGDPNGKVQFHFGVAGSNEWKAESTGGYNDGEWHHVVGLVDVGESDIFIWIDGGDVTDSTTKLGTPTGISNPSTAIGALATSSASRFNGSLSDVAVYSGNHPNIARHFGARTAGINESTGARIERICEYVGIPTNLI